MNDRRRLAPLLSRTEREGASTQWDEASFMNSITSLSADEHTPFPEPGRRTARARRSHGGGVESLFSATCRWRVVRVGPGVARRAPRHTPYRSAGLILTRTVTYDARGHPSLITTAVPAHEQRAQSVAAVSSSNRTPMSPSLPEVASLAAAASHTSSPEAVAITGFVMPPAPWSPPSQQQQQQQQQQHHERVSDPVKPPTNASSQIPKVNSTSAAHSASVKSASPAAAIPPAAAAAPMSQQERQREAQEQQQFSEMLAQFPLLSVLPPRTMTEQRYRDEDDAEPATPHLFTPASGGSTAVGYSSSRSSGPASLRLAEVEDITVSIGQHCDDGPSVRSVMWGGCRPASMRAAVWRLLCGGYAPAGLARQARELSRKRNQYAAAVRQYWPLAHHRETHRSGASGRPSSLSTSVLLPHTDAPETQPGLTASPSLDQLPASPSRSTQQSHDAGIGSPLLPTASRLLYYQKRTQDQRRQNQLLESLSSNGQSASATTTLTTGLTSPLSSVFPAHSGRGGREPSTQAVPSHASSLLEDGVGPSLPAYERAILNQLALDLPRHHAAMYHIPRLINSMARCLFLWAQRHPAVGYVQGMDEVVGVFYTVFLTSAVRQFAHKMDDDATTALPRWSSPLRLLTDPATAGTTTTTMPPNCNSKTGDSRPPNKKANVLSGALDEVAVHAWSRETLELVLDRCISSSTLLQVESDCYHCAGRVLSTLQANYTPGLSGITRAGELMETVIGHAGHGALLTYLSESSGMRLRDGCYQWLHCLLARELPLQLLLPLWDSYLSAGEDNIMTVHVCVCAALVIDLEKHLRGAPPEMTLRVLQKPFDAAFPVLAQDIEKRQKGQSSDEDAPPLPPSRWTKPIEWMEVIIADGYRLWRQFT